MSIGINTEKAKEIHKDHIRSVRNPLLQEKDIEFIRSIESGNSENIERISEEKQVLRDVTEIVNSVVISSSSVLEVTEELKQVWDESILGPNPLI
jgi:hypothetical protein